MPGHPVILDPGKYLNRPRHASTISSIFVIETNSTDCLRRNRSSNGLLLRFRDLGLEGTLMSGGWVKKDV